GKPSGKWTSRQLIKPAVNRSPSRLTEQLGRAPHALRCYLVCQLFSSHPLRPIHAITPKPEAKRGRAGGTGVAVTVALSIWLAGPKPLSEPPEPKQDTAPVPLCTR